MASDLHIHIPWPGDHYSPSTGSATMAVIFGHAQQHARHGGTSRILVARGTRHDYPVGDCIEVDFKILPLARHKIVDAVLGRMRMPRPFESAVYASAAKAIPADFTGPVLVQNSPGAIPILKKLRPRAQVCLYAVNALFRTYSRGEARRVVDVADRIICCSEFIANDLRQKLGRDDGKIRVVHNGVDIESFAPSSDPNRVPVILFVGRMVPEKGADLLLRAAQKIAQGREFKVRLVGSRNFSPNDPHSPFETELRRLAEPLGERVEFQPAVDRVQLVREYESCSIFCAPANWDDPFPLTVLEAMACAKPVVSARRGGIPESGGDAIHYFSPPDTDELAAHLAFLVDNQSAREEWGRRARERVTLFKWENQYRKLRAALES